jgi:hypothetical protein
MRKGPRMTEQPPPAELSRRQVLKTYAAPTIAVIGVAATGSFSTSGRVVALPDTDAVGKAKGKDKGNGKGEDKGKGKEK